MSIPKTMIFVDKIDEAINIAAYLRTLLDESARSRESKLIRSFSSNNEASPRGEILDDFANGDTRVLICTDAAGLGVDIRDALWSNYLLGRDITPKAWDNVYRKCNPTAMSLLI